MANENNDAKAKAAAERAAADKKAAAEKAEAERIAALPAQPDPAPDAPRNLTRETIEEQLVGQFMAAGKSSDEAKSLAKKRALEIIPADAK